MWLLFRNKLMTIWQAILLGVVQGLTEFLPVSSSGHLVLVEKLLGLSVQNLRFEVVVHLGTLLAVIIVFRGKIVKVLAGLFCGRVRYRKGKLRFPNEHTRLAWLLVMASIPALVAGLVFGRVIEQDLLTPLSVGIFLLITGGILFGTRFVHPPSGRANWRNSLIVGFAQVLAILPGISRSGITISAGIYSGIERKQSAEFSFLLVIPLILGAGISKVGQMLKTGIAPSEITILLAGAVPAAVSGYLALRVLLEIIKKGRLDYFAYYCWLVGLIVIASEFQ